MPVPSIQRAANFTQTGRGIRAWAASRPRTTTTTRHGARGGSDRRVQRRTTQSSSLSFPPYRCSIPRRRRSRLPVAMPCPSRWPTTSTRMPPRSTAPRRLDATPAYTPSSASMYFTDATDLSPFKRRGGKLMVYHGGADSSVSLNDTLRWYERVARPIGRSGQDFAGMYVVPGMTHRRGGPATDNFDMLPQLVQWVEAGTAPDSVLAKASNPGH